MANSWQEPMKPNQKGFSVWVAIATVCPLLQSWVGVGDFLWSFGLWNSPEIPTMAGEGRRGNSTEQAHLLALFALWGGLQGIVHSVPSASAAVTSLFTTSLSQKAAGHSAVIERAAVIIWEGTYFISDQITFISLDNFHEFWNRIGTHTRQRVCLCASRRGAGQRVLKCICS